MISLNNVTKTYRDGTSALQQVTLMIETGEFVYLKGKSGSGKSTLLKVLYGQEKVNRGQVRLADHHVHKMNNRKIHKLRREIGVVFQDYQLLSYKTVFDNIAYVLEVTGYPKEKINDKVIEALEKVGLKHKIFEYPSNCSGGEQQRIAIARAIVHDPIVLLADEPTGNLDPQNAYSILKVLHKINKSGTTVIMATHDQSLVDKMPSRVIELEKGYLTKDRSINHTMMILSSRMGEQYII
ncbi:cell division ATP-binding protein FtsE [Marinilactibacillus psychrotolerans]|uniref:Cell division ATP-binding protein FtsE n=1 Tax=Marinilactibacillus psychrotolerans TaxID=191770 RepID=A0A5R9C8C1_9LACT|nr:cell division ATP-binding protein FtsE [Marinilactibacillus psychrotolerans]TLQ09339.1 cell division ATP-binding protein FtsE [Marinilactibacillus psychrotolerans]GEQ33655.1 cell division protein FtsE [Marinilactibacillus psychrotolerans]